MVAINWTPKFNDWPEDDPVLSTPDVVRLYERGFAGAKYSPEEQERFRETIRAGGGTPDAEAVTHAFGLAESGKGKLSLPYLAVEQLYPGSLPGPGQERGDCVSHNEKNAALVTLCGEVVAGKPDEVSGQVEGAPEVPPEGVRNGVLSTEWIYWQRGYNGDGWYCSASARAVIEKGILIRKPYPELGIDLTEYSGRLAGRYGRQSPPANMVDVGDDHLIRTATIINSWEELRDLVANLYGVSSCGSEGFSSERDESGVSRRRGSWAHAMAIIGADDRPIAHERYGEGLALVLNSWNLWNRGPRAIMGTDGTVSPEVTGVLAEVLSRFRSPAGGILIPEGSFWARWSDIRRRDFHALSGVNGWPPQKLPDWGTPEW